MYTLLITHRQAIIQHQDIKLNIYHAKMHGRKYFADINVVWVWACMLDFSGEFPYFVTYKDEDSLEMCGKGWWQVLHFNVLQIWWENVHHLFWWEIVKTILGLKFSEIENLIFMKMKQRSRPLKEHLTPLTGQVDGLRLSLGLCGVLLGLLEAWVNLLVFRVRLWGCLRLLGLNLHLGVLPLLVQVGLELLGHETPRHLDWCDNVWVCCMCYRVCVVKNT